MNGLPLAAVVSALLLFGCANTGDKPDPVRLGGAEWTLTELYDSKPLIPEDARPPTLVFDEGEGQLSGFAGCNTFGAAYTRSEDLLTIGPTRTTLMACPDPLGQIEQRFLQALGETTGARRVGSTLELVAGERVVARFRAP